MASYRITTSAVLILGIICIVTAISNTTMIASKKDDCKGSAISLACCKAGKQNSCCDNLAAGNAIGNCDGVLGQDLNVAIGLIAGALNLNVCGLKGATCSPGSVCILDAANILASSAPDDNDFYCCYTWDPLKTGYACKNSADEDVILQCAQKDNTNTTTSTTTRHGENAEVQNFSCCSYVQCSDFSAYTD